MTNRNEGDDWRCHGWDDHIHGQLEHGRSLTFRQKLEWLDEMTDLVGRLRANPDWPGNRTTDERRTDLRASS